MESKDISITFKRSAKELQLDAHHSADKMKTMLYEITKSGTWKTPQQLQQSFTARVSNKLVRFKHFAPTVPTFENVIVPLAEFTNNHNARYYPRIFLADVSTDERIRKASNYYKQIVDGSSVNGAVAKQMYKLVRKVSNNKQEMDKLDDEDKQLVRKMELNYRLKGLELSTVLADKLFRIGSRLAKIEAKFLSNISNFTASTLFSQTELEGLPADFFAGRKASSTSGVFKYRVTTASSDYDMVMQHAQLEATRKHMFKLYNTRCPDNVQLLQTAVDLRLEKAKILGYSNYAELALETQMAKTPEAVLNMLDNLQARLTPMAKLELEMLTVLKQQDMEQAGLPFTGFFQWDIRYYQCNVHKSDQIISDVREYFPLDRVICGLLNIYEQLLGVSIIKVANVDVWHPDVEYYQVLESGSKEMVGSFYLDLFFRPNKSHSAVTCKLCPGFQTKNKQQILPKVAMVTSLTPPCAGQPCLLQHADVVLLMHELGHVFHEVCSQTKWSQLHGFEIESDFAESPPQMMENWVWEPTVLSKFAFHYKTNVPIPQELLSSIIQSRQKWPALFNLRRIALAKYDMHIHNIQTSNIDVKQQYNEMLDEITMIGTDDLVLDGVARFNHICGGYASTYYSYVWSNVYAADMFASRFKQEGLDNAQTGREYRNEILKPGGSRDPIVSLKKFLGRKPTSDAFFKAIQIGLEETSKN